LENVWTPYLYRMSSSNSVSRFEPKIYGMFKSRHIGLMSVSQKVANIEVWLGSTRKTELWLVERYETVLQMI